jgi:hypothetical protein
VVQAVVLAWLVLASIGLLASGGLSLALRLVLAGALWLTAWPSMRREISLLTPGALKRIEAGGGCDDWRVASGPWGPAVPACLDPQCAVLGPVLWLRIDTAAGPHRACLVDRALAMRLRLSGWLATNC